MPKIQTKGPINQHKRMAMGEKITGIGTNSGDEELTEKEQGQAEEEKEMGKAF
jgi:hypothetical protein